VTRITPRQLKALWALSHRAGMDDREVHELVAARTGRASVRDLSRAEAGGLIDELSAKLEGRLLRPQRPGGITRSQEARLARCAEEMGWSPERVGALARRMYGVPHVLALTMRQASGLIQALTVIAARNAPRREADV
jgi:hypothetical protein